MGHQSAESWVERIREATERGGLTVMRALVLCRTTPIADALRRAVARAGGIVGLEITTPMALATTARGEPIRETVKPAPSPRPRCRLLDRVGDPLARPGLEAHVGGLARRLRTHERCGGELPVDQTLSDLREAAVDGWAADDAEEAQTWLISALERRVEEPLRGPSASAAYHRVFAVGFGDPERTGAPDWESTYTSQWLGAHDGRPLTPLTAFERRVLSLLQAEPLGAFDAVPPAGLAALQVTDPAAEARLAARMLLHAQAEGREALVLVPDGATATRLRAAARRNGAAIGGAEQSALSGHALSALFRDALPWFSGEPDPALRASLLDAVLTSPLCGGHFPAPIREALAREVRGFYAGEEDVLEAGRETRLSARDMSEVIGAARIVEAPLSVWIRRVGELVSKPGKPAHRRRAAVLAARLLRLRQCVAGEPFVRDTDAEVVEGPDRGMVGAATIDDVDTITWPAPGALGALRRFLLDCHLRVHQDPIARELLATLREASDTPATGPELARALRGSASTGWTDDGVDVLTYDDYDGREVDLLLLLGVHNKGLTSAPTPDPVLSEAALWALGEPAGRRRIVFRSLQALRAAANARETLAIVPSRDSTGRAVVPPIQVALDWKAGAEALARLDLSAGRIATDSYGLCLTGLPETADRFVLTRNSDSEPAAAPQGDPEVCRLATQASLEWYRAGVGAVARPTAPEVEGQATLLDLLRQFDPFAPPWLGRWLGDVGEVAWHSNDDGKLLPWSVSSHFVPLTNCLYRFFVERVLKIKEREPASDELDPAEEGTTIHSVFEALSPLDGVGIPWRVDGDGEALATAKHVTSTRLVATTLTRFDREKGSLHLTPSIEVATDGLRGRWDRHWAGYVDTRIRSRDAAQEGAAGAFAELVRGLPGYEEVLQSLDSVMVGWVVADDTGRMSKLAKWLDAALEATAGQDVLAGRPGKDLAALCKGTIPQREAAPLEPFITRTDFAELAALLGSSLQSFRALTSVLSGSMLAVLPEVPFGDKVDNNDGVLYPGADRLRAACLRLAGRDLQVHGQVDRVMVVEGDGGPRLQILDYKAGTPKTKKVVDEGLASLELPQLPVYALVLATLLRSGEAVGRIPAGSAVGAVGYDFVRKRSESGLLDGYLTDAEELARIEDVLSGLTERALSGRWSLVPLRDDVAGKGSWGYPKGRCSLRDASRFEALPVTIDLTDPEMTSDQEGDA